MFINYLKIAIRNLLRSKLFSLINILGLAISMSICLLVIKMIFGMYSCDRFHVNKDRIYRILTYEQRRDGTGSELATTPEPLARELEKIAGIERVVRIRKNFSGDVYYKDKVVPVSGLITDPIFFNVFSFELQRGDPQTALTEPYSIILTPEWARKVFGDKDPVSETISLKNLGDYKVTGITKSITQLKTNLKFECLASASTLPSLEHKGINSNTIDNWKNYFRTYTFVMIRNGTDISYIENELQNIIKTHIHDSELNMEYRLQPLKEISPGKRLVNQMGEPTEPIIAYILILIAVILILTASFTYTTLSVARALDRAKEVGVRKVFGANRFDLFIQFIGEAIILSFISLNFAYIILTFLEPGVYNIDYYIRDAFQLTKTPSDLYLSFILFTLILGCITGLAPALYLSKFKPVEVFKDLSKIRLFSRANLHKVLIIFQFTISLLLIFFVIISYKQVQFQRTVNYGFNVDDIINIELQEMEFEVFKNKLLQIPSVEYVTASDYLPGTGVMHIQFVKSDKIPDSAIISHLSIDPDFISALNISILAGNDFQEYMYPNLENYALINESAVLYLGYSNPSEALNRFITIENKEAQIIGVVRDFVNQSTYVKPDPLVLRIIPDWFDYAVVKLNPGYDKAKVLSKIEESWKELNPYQLFRYKLYTDQITEYENAAMKIVKISGFITVLVIVIAILGLLGMVVYSNQKRINEIGIRKVMGANNKEVLWMISKSFLYLMFLAVLIATPLALFSGKMILQNAYNHVSLKPGFFITGILFLLIIGVITVFSQTWKAANQNPVDALRYE